MCFGSDFADLAGEPSPLPQTTTPFDSDQALTLEPWESSADETGSERKANRSERDRQVLATLFRPAYETLKKRASTTSWMPTSKKQANPNEPSPAARSDRFASQEDPPPSQASWMVRI